MIEKLKNILISKVFANYSHMTISQLVNVAVNLGIYPIVIRILGADVYGVYVFALAIMYNMKVFVDFGLSIPIVKRFIDCESDIEGENRVVTAVTMVRTLFFLVLFGVLVLCVVFVPMLQKNAVVYLVVALQMLAEIYSFTWVYQAKQKMHIVTYFVVGMRLASIPLILLYVDGPSDLLTFAVLNTSSILLGSILIAGHLVKVEGMRIKRVSMKEVKSILSDGIPFISSDLIGTIRNEAAVLFVGSFLGMREVAIYDLANKVITVPRTFIANVNMALYPDVLSTGKYDVRKLIRYEYLLGGAVIAGVVLLGYWAVLILGGAEMIDAYPVCLILSVSIMTWLVSGAYINFVFVPARKYGLVATKQICAVVGFLVAGVPLMYFYGNVYAFAIALIVSELVDVAYCHYAAYRYKL